MCIIKCRTLLELCVDFVLENKIKGIFIEKLVNLNFCTHLIFLYIYIYIYIPLVPGSASVREVIPARISFMGQVFLKIISIEWEYLKPYNPEDIICIKNSYLSYDYLLRIFLII